MFPDIQLKHWSKLRYLDPVPVLRGLRQLELGLANTEMDQRVRRLRTAKLKPEREARDAALFCLGMSSRLGLPVSFAPLEESDYDFVTRTDHHQDLYFTPVQLKELVPEDLNPASSFDALLATLRSKTLFSNTALVIRLNRTLKQVKFSADQFDGLPFKEVWMFWSASPDATKWRLLGNALSNPFVSEFEYPSD